MQPRHLDSNLFLSLSNSLEKYKKPKNIYAGIGLCTSSGMSQGVPFDLISMVLCAERLRRELNASKVYYIIADSHAMLTGHGHEKVVPYAMGLSKILDNIIKELDIPHIYFISSFLEDLEYKFINNIKDSQKYMRAQMEDMFYFINNHNVGYKLGWKYNRQIKCSKKLGYDEWYFDKQARALDIPIKYCYTQPGFTMHDNVMMAAPYICLDPENRILFRDKNLKSKLFYLISHQSKSINLYRQYLMDIQLLHCNLFNKPIKGLVPFLADIIKKLS